MNSDRPHTWRDSLSDALLYVVMALIVLAIIVAVVGIRYAMAGGDWSCVPSADPALCATVNGLNR